MALTLRLDKEQTASLEKLSDYLGENTAAGTIKKMIKLYMHNQEHLDRTLFDLNQIQVQHEKLCRSLKLINHEQKIISEFVD